MEGLAALMEGFGFREPNGGEELSGEFIFLK